ncbi:MAG: M28 family metallopeptidase [Firmicutes bacterium]|nr:M28 family metallopeptidase [Bacillota bacterium]
MTNNTKQYADYAEEQIRHICESFGKREPGSKGERDSQEYLAGEIKQNGWANEVSLQDFKVAPKAFLIFTKILPFLMAIGIGLFLLHPVALIVAVAVSLFFFVSHMILYRLVLNPFFKKKTSVNLYAVKSPLGEVKRRIIFGGHADSAYEMTLGHKFGAKPAKLLIVTAIVGILVSLAMSITALHFKMLGSYTDMHKWIFFGISVAFLPFIFLILFFIDFKTVVDGANDNLSASLVAVCVLKYLKDNNINYENTEVCALNTGSEEAGLRGAKAFVKQNLSLLKDKNVETVFVGLETLGQLEHFQVISKDLNGIVKHDKRAVKLIDKSAEKHFDKPLPHKGVPLGSTDAAAFAQKGIPAVAILGMEHTPAPFYHTRLDNADNLSVECMQKAFEVCITAVEIFNENGL